MSKFKVGDKVTLLETAKVIYPKLADHPFHVIKEISEHNDTVVVLEFEYWFIHENYLEPYIEEVDEPTTAPVNEPFTEEVDENDIVYQGQEAKLDIFSEATIERQSTTIVAPFGYEIGDIQVTYRRKSNG